MKSKKIILLIIILHFLTSCNLEPGSYVNVRSYEINVFESELKNKISAFYNQNPSFKVPEEYNLVSHQNSHWYFVYFYIKKDDIIISTWIRGDKYSDSPLTEWALIAISEDSTHNEWKSINEDLNDERKNYVIRTFESSILSKISPSSK